MRRARLKWSRLWRHFWDRGDSRRERDRLAVEVEQEEIVRHRMKKDESVTCLSTP